MLVRKLSIQIHIEEGSTFVQADPDEDLFDVVDRDLNRLVQTLLDDAALKTRLDELTYQHCSAAYITMQEELD